MVTVVTVMDREKVEKLFNPQNTNQKYTQSTEALLSVIQQQKNASQSFGETRFVIPNP